MADQGTLEKLVALLKGGNTFGGAKFGGNTFGGQQFGASAHPSVTVKATPPPLPAFQIPGMNAQGLQGLAQAAKPATPVAAVPSPPPVVPPGNQPGVVPPTPNNGAMPPIQNGGFVANASNFVPVPQTNSELEKWRAYMDQMQFARQGA